MLSELSKQALQVCVERAFDCVKKNVGKSQKLYDFFRHDLNNATDEEKDYVLELIVEQFCCHISLGNYKSNTTMDVQPRKVEVFKRSLKVFFNLYDPIHTHGVLGDWEEKREEILKSFWFGKTVLDIVEQLEEDNSVDNLYAWMEDRKKQKAI